MITHKQSRALLLTGMALALPLPAVAEELAVELGGYVAGGVDHYGAFYDEEGASSTTRGVLRNAKLQLELAWGEHWEAELDGGYSIEGDKKEAELGDAYVQYLGDRRFRATLGRFKEPFGLERLTSYSSINTSERSLVTSAFAPGRSTGLQVGQFRKSGTWALGVFTDEPDGGSTRAVTGRVTRAPVRSDAGVLHLGAAASWRDLNDERFQIKDEGEVFSADNVIRSPRFDARDSWLAGLEAAWLSGRLALSAEAMTQSVRRTNGERWQYSGAYLQASLFLTEDQRRYSRGEFKRVKPQHRGGAWELVLRHSAVDLRDRGLGAEASVTAVGLNYYLGKAFQVRVNYLLPEISGNTLMVNPDGDAATVRAVFRF
ncbi:OprO/OprP family phosphate-selective porin [Marinobacter sp. SS5-14b]|uniref:OprO/OprP family phosphate-selective porin n=1 Tax=Marinobacter sp. SS5-14b TaxID=3050456 RepID=UPI0026DF38C1|nr:porin [Marinobacter sp. SS5-14b]